MEAHQTSAGTARNLRLPHDMSERLRLEAFKQRRPATGIIRDAIQLYFDALDKSEAKARAKAPAEA